VTAFGTSVERLHLNQTNPDPALGDVRSTAEAGPHPFLTNPVIGQAMSMAIDRALLVEVGYGAGGQPTCNVLPAPELYASTANDACLTQDIRAPSRFWMKPASSTPTATASANTKARR
jgi:peptide/nickel transport system substrate-binding protein